MKGGVPTWIFAHLDHQLGNPGNFLVKLALHLVKHVDELFMCVFQSRVDLAFDQFLFAMQCDLKTGISLGGTRRQR